MSLKVSELRYDRAEVALLLGVSQHNVQRCVRSRPGFPSALPGTYPPLWSKKAVDDYFHSDAGRRQLREDGGEIVTRVITMTPDEIEEERAKLHATYGRRA